MEPQKNIVPCNWVYNSSPYAGLKKYDVIFKVLGLSLSFAKVESQGLKMNVFGYRRAMEFSWKYIIVANCILNFISH